MTDLDARVAPLMDDADTYAATQRMEDRYELEQAIRAELQKPALHEPCTWEEAARAWHLHTVSSGSPIDCMLVAINSVLQSRTHHMSSESARIDYCELQAIAEEYKLPFNAFCAAVRKFLQGRAKPAAPSKRKEAMHLHKFEALGAEEPTQEEITDAHHALLEAAEAVLSNEEHAVSCGARSYQKESPTWQVYKDLDAAIRGKEEKT